MKTISSILVILICIAIPSHAQDYYFPLGNRKTEATILSTSYTSMKMQFSLQGISGKDVKTKDGKHFTELYFGKGYSMGEIGNPKLPAFKKLIQIPHGSDVKLKVTGYFEEIIDLKSLGVTKELYPTQPSLRKDQDETDQPFYYNKQAYEARGFNDQPIATIEILGTMRGVRIARVDITPVNYDPSTQSLKVYNDIEVDVIFENVNKSLNDIISSKTYSPYFEPVYEILENPSLKSVYDDYPDLTNYPVKMLIVSHRMFETTLEPYIAWKTKKGFYVEVAYTDDIGVTSSAIKDFVHGKYNEATAVDPAPTFLVLVGDIDQVPASATGSASGRKTDLYYASVDGDYFPEMYYGRMSATTTNQLENIINKILYYEQYQFEDPTYLNNATLIAGTDGTWNYNVGQPTVKYGTANYFNADNGFNTVWGYGVSNDPNNPNNSSGYAGCYDNDRISVSLINYTAHCSENEWSGPKLTISGVNLMTNTNKYPLAIGNCCLSGDFGHLESIGEAWIRAESKGAVTYIGSSPSSYWFEDFYWSVGAFPITGNNDGYVPSFEETTFGAYDASFKTEYLCASALIFVGNLAVTEVDLQSYASQSSPLYYWQAYNVLGDPSLIPFLTEAEQNVVSHMEIAPIGLDFYAVSALPGSYVAISKDGILHGAAYVDKTGEAEVPIDPILEGGDVDIVVTRPQTIPYTTQVQAAALEGPFIVLDRYIINDETGNNNGLADFGEVFSIDVTLKNVGADIGENIAASLIGTDDYFVLSSAGPTSFGNILATESENTVTVNSAFVLALASNVPDQYNASILLEITDGTNTWESNLKISANAPVFSIGDLTIDDFGEGIPGVLDPGETANAVIRISNTGHADSHSITANLTTSSPNININGNESISLGVLAAGASTEATYSISAAGETPAETSVILNLNIQAGQYEYSDDLELIIGYIPEHFMDNVSVTSCIGRFYDSGGIDANYSNNESFTKTFYPSSNDEVLMFNFSSFTTEAGYDYLYIYDGENTSASQFSGSPFNGSQSPSMIMASNDLGAITFRFTSDGSVTQSGWEADFYCVDLTVPPACSSNPHPNIGDIVLLNPSTFSWDAIPGALEYLVYVGEETLPAEPTAIVNTNIYEVDELLSYTNYVWKVVPKNDSGQAEGCSTWSFSTLDIASIYTMQSTTLSTCKAHFFDSGGPSSNYGNNENYTLTVYPASSSARTKVTFSSFSVENLYDSLKIYDGIDATATLVISLTGDTIPNAVVATNDEGALTFVFTSDANITGSGWEAYLTCEGGHNVNFIITNSQSSPVIGADVRFASYGIVTSDSYGEAIFSSVFEAEDLDYTISHDDFHTHTGSLTMANEDLNVDIVMTALSNNFILLESIVLYPNPFNQFIKVSGLERIQNVEVRNIMGQKLIHIDSPGQDLLIPTSSINTGVYFIVFTLDTGEQTVRRMVKQ